MMMDDDHASLGGYAGAYRLLAMGGRGGNDDAAAAASEAVLRTETPVLFIPGHMGR